MKDLFQILKPFADYVSAWVEYLETPNPFAFEPKTIDAGDLSSPSLSKAIKEYFDVDGVETTMQNVMAYFKDFKALEDEWSELDQDYYRHIGEALSNGRTFLQRLADMSFRNGCSRERILAIMGVEPSVGVVPSEGKDDVAAVDDGQQQEKTKPTRKRGRPKKTLKDCMIDDEDERKRNRLHEIWGKSFGKRAALIIVACVKLGWMVKPTYKQVKDEFGDIGSQQAFTPYLSECKFSEDEIDGVMKTLNVLD